MADKLAVALINHKGGVGKTTLACILTQIGLTKGLSVAAVDMDPQKNLSGVLELAADQPGYERLTVTDTLTDRADFIIIDCPPALNDATAAVIDFADITLVPVMADIFSVSNLAPVYNFAQQREKSHEQTAIVKVGFDKRALVEMVASVIEETDYHVAGDVPINRLIPYNIALGNIWEHRIALTSRAAYYTLYDNIWYAYKNMLKGNFERAWRS